MTLPVGARLGPYEIGPKIGAGGMGEVYRATDTKLKRDVAIKVLPPHFTEDKERLARFQREAQLLAQLHHPCIASIFGLEESNGSSAIVMELVEGPTLAERLAAGALSIEDSLSIARQMADALEDAHEKGIIHRDLKPQNVKVTFDGKVKLLDFGLAKAMDPVASGVISASQVAASPTLTLGATAQGVILGTAAYMSPEQAKGMAVDRRSDVWAFGVVLYEMLAGGRLFEGPTVAETLAQVLTRTPDLDALPPATPAAVRQLLRRCLERNPKNRLHDIADARIALDEIAHGEPDASGPAKSGIALAGPAAPARGRLPWVVASIAVFVAVAVITHGVVTRQRADAPAASKPVTAFGVLVPGDTALPRSQSPLLDLSRDGRTLVFVAEGKEGTSIYRRALDSLRIVRVAGTDGAQQPVLSPDGKWIAFFAGGKLHKVPAEGGSATTLAEARAPRGVAWLPDGSLIFSPMFNSGLLRVGATGSEPVPLTKLDPARKERSHRWPEVLPDGKTVLFTVGLIARPGDYDESPIDAVRLDTGERRTVLEGARMARYSTTGRLVFQRRQSLLAVRFDPANLQRLGEPFTLQEDVGGETSSGAGYFAVRAGLLAFAPESAIPGDRVLVLVDRQGKETELDAGVAAFNNPNFSPDGKKLAFSIGSGSAADDDVFVYDLASARTQRLTFGKGNGLPIFTPDGRRVLYAKGRSGETGVASKAADGSGDETQILRGSELSRLDAWMPDARHLIGTNTSQSLDIEVLDTKDGTTAPLFASPTAAEYAAALSPDGRYIAYTSTETGVDQVFVETMPKGGGKWQISTTLGALPRFSPDGRELYFVVDETIMAVDVDTTGVFRAGAPRLLLRGPYELRTIPARNYDVGPDGRFVFVKRKVASKTPREIVVLDGWTSLDPGNQR